MLIKIKFYKQQQKNPSHYNSIVEIILSESVDGGGGLWWEWNG